MNMNKILDGDIVKLRPEYSSPGERKYLFVAKDINPDTNRCIIVCINGITTIPSSECVGLEMIESTGFNVKDYNLEKKGAKIQ